MSVNMLLFILIIVGLIIFIIAVKGGVKAAFRIIFILLGIFLIAVGAYGLFTQLIN